MVVSARAEVLGPFRIAMIVHPVADLEDLFFHAV